VTGQISRDDDDDDGEKRGTDDCDDRWKPAACLPLYSRLSFNHYDRL